MKGRGFLLFDKLKSLFDLRRLVILAVSRSVKKRHAVSTLNLNISSSVVKATVIGHPPGSAAVVRVSVEPIGLAHLFLTHGSDLLELLGSTCVNDLDLIGVIIDLD